MSRQPEEAPDARDYDVIVIGSGFGGSVSALRLTEKGYPVGVLEAGRRFAPRNKATANPTRCTSRKARKPPATWPTRATACPAPPPVSC